MENILEVAGRKDLSMDVVDESDAPDDTVPDGIGFGAAKERADQQTDLGDFE